MLLPKTTVVAAPAAATAYLLVRVEKHAGHECLVQGLVDVLHTLGGWVGGVTQAGAGLRLLEAGGRAEGT